jgi:hypothetical protein
VCRVIRVASRVSQLPLRGARVSNQGQNRPSKHHKVSLTPLLVGFINGIGQKRKSHHVITINSPAALPGISIYRSRFRRAILDHRARFGCDRLPSRNVLDGHERCAVIKDATYFSPVAMIFA